MGEREDDSLDVFLGSLEAAVPSFGNNMLIADELSSEEIELHAPPQKGGPRPKKKFSYEDDVVGNAAAVRVLKEIEDRGFAFRDDLGSAFTGLGLGSEVKQVLSVARVRKPTEVQRRVVPAVLAGESVVVVSPTGSGKTLAYMLPLLVRILKARAAGAARGLSLLVLVPTTELSIQLFSVAEPLCTPLSLKALCAHGGVGLSALHGHLRAHSADVLIATPGKFLELLRVFPALLAPTLFFVFDEFDRLFDKGFLSQIGFLLSDTFNGGQFLFVSASSPGSFIRSIQQTVAARHIQVEQERGRRLRHRVFFGEEEDGEPAHTEKKMRSIEQIVKRHKKTILFARTREEANTLALSLGHLSLPLMLVHSEVGEKERAEGICTFRRWKKGVLVGTSLLSRGLDIEGLDAVVNFSCPQSYEECVHRFGRVGRVGRKGYVFTFVSPGDSKYAVEVLRFLKKQGLEAPPRLVEMAQRFISAIERGEERLHNAYKGRGVWHIADGKQRVEKALHSMDVLRAKEKIEEVNREMGRP